jgi:hypothetical protein
MKNVRGIKGAAAINAIISFVIKIGNKKAILPTSI